MKNERIEPYFTENEERRLEKQVRNMSFEVREKYLERTADLYLAEIGDKYGALRDGE